LRTTVGWLEQVVLPDRAQPVLPFANMIAAMDSNSDDDGIATFVSLNNKFYYMHFFEDSDTESDDDANLMVAVESVLHEENGAYMPKWRGSVMGRATNLDRSRENGHVQLYIYYFHLETALYQNYFHRRFHMSRKLFGRITEDVCLHGFSSYKKCSAAIRMLPYGVAADLVDEYMRMSESICIESMYNFCRVIISIFGEEYLREPNLEDTQWLLSINEKRSFPGMLGSIDCMYWE
jgi:hypothetical protein